MLYFNNNSEKKKKTQKYLLFPVLVCKRNSAELYDKHCMFIDSLVLCSAQLKSEAE